MTKKSNKISQTIQMDTETKIESIFFLNQEFVDESEKPAIKLISKHGNELIVKARDMTKEVQTFLKNHTDLARIENTILIGVPSKNVNIDGIRVKKGFDKTNGQHTLTMISIDIASAQLNYNTKIKPALIKGGYGHGKDKRECSPIITRKEKRTCELY